MYWLKKSWLANIAEVINFFTISDSKIWEKSILSV